MVQLKRHVHPHLHLSQHLKESLGQGLVEVVGQLQRHVHPHLHLSQHLQLPVERERGHLQSRGLIETQSLGNLIFVRINTIKNDNKYWSEEERTYIK